VSRTSGRSASRLAAILDALPDALLLSDASGLVVNANAVALELFEGESAERLLGKPIALLLAEQMATVTLCHIATKDLAAHTRRAEVLVVAVGKPGLITANHVKEGAIVIDVGINRITLPDGTKKTVGDVDAEGVYAKASRLSPVPGGVGPMTVAMLLKNTLRSAQLLGGGKF